MKFKFLIFISSVILFFAIIPLRKFGSVELSILFGFVAYFFLTMFWLSQVEKKMQVWKILLLLLIGKWLLESYSRIFYFEQTYGSLPDSIIHTLGIVCGYFYWRLQNPFNILTAFLGCLITVFMFFQGWGDWLHYKDFGTFTGRIEAYKLQQNIHGINQSGDRLTNQSFENKIVLLDFWNTRCGVCFQKFPQLQAVYEKYKDDDSIAIFAVNKPLEEDKKDEAFLVIREEGFSFPVLLPEDEELAEKFGVKAYPTTFVIDRQGYVIFRGDIEKAVALIQEIKGKN